MIPSDTKKLQRKPKKHPDASKDDPKELPRPETQPERCRERSPGDGPRPQPILGAKRAVLGASRRPPLREAMRADLY